MDLGTIVGVGKILGGLFGKKKKDPTPYDNLLSQAAGARAAAEQYGFNPLTMLQYGQTAGAMSSGSDTPPLASVEVILGGIEDLGMSLSGKAAQSKALNDFARDRNSLSVDPYRRGLYARPASVTSTIGGTTSPLGGNTATHYPANGYDYGGYGGQTSRVPSGVVSSGSGSGTGGDGLRPLETVDPTDPRRPVDNAPVKTTPGFMVVDNPYLDGPVWVPTLDGEEALQWYDWPTLGMAWAGSRLFQSQSATAGPGRPDYTHEHWDKLKKDHEDRLAKKRADGVFGFPDHNQNPSYPPSWELLPMYRY